MDLESSWEDYEYFQMSKEDHTSKLDEDNLLLEDVICINSILPDDIIERVLGLLPVSAIIGVGCVCKKWNDLVHSEIFIQNFSSTSSQKPWYLMFTSDSDPLGHVYDPVVSKWNKFEIPYVEMPSWDIVSSSGLVCCMDNDSRGKLYVCNPMTKHCRKLKVITGAEDSDYCALAISVDKSSLSYTVTIVRSKQAPGDLFDWDLSIDVYSSEKNSWACPVDVNLQTWRSGSDSVICGGILYFAVYLTTTMRQPHPRYGVLAYDLASESFDLDVVARLIQSPCLVTCMRLINLEEELVVVGGIEKIDRPGIMKGIGIWVLKGKKWEEVSRMPNKLFNGFGELDDVFASSGFGKLIYIQGYGSPALLMFDMNTKEWRWSRKCPATKKFPLQLFSGICFQPRLDISL